MRNLLNNRPQLCSGAVLRRLFSGGYVVLLTYLLVVPHPLWMFGASGKTAEESIDRSISGFVQHVSAYAILCVLLVTAFGRGGKRALLFCAVFSLGHAVLTEVIQYFVPFRHPDWRDVLANVLGVIVGAGATAGFHLVRCRLRASPGEPVTEAGRPQCDVPVATPSSTGQQG